MDRNQYDHAKEALNKIQFLMHTDGLRDEQIKSRPVTKNLYTYLVYGTRWNPPKDMDGAHKRDRQAILTSPVPVHQDHSSENMTSINKDRKEDPGNYRRHRDLGSREEHGADHHEGNHTTHAGQPGDHAQEA
ncbi:hypothetical protein WISP_78893 [Willisornis vidua]|uniref:Uncharacterized protein n=1 Tax=Willisornis vidua TaxID=1566151 RepID=A0ABQ9D5R7_9PASS|nr:hypothetical protein WISP_78893 [Willisornis vidua]